MINLKDNFSTIETFISKNISKFKQENGTPKTIGIYSHPVYGWVSINFNKTKTLEETESNCPDFEFVEFDLIEFSDWEVKYFDESDTLILTEKGETITLDDEDGDEGFNEPVFNLLKSALVNIIPNNPHSEFFVQMLDSEFEEQIKTTPHNTSVISKAFRKFFGSK